MPIHAKKSQWTHEAGAFHFLAGGSRHSQDSESCQQRSCKPEPSPDHLQSIFILALTTSVCSCAATCFISRSCMSLTVTNVCSDCRHLRSTARVSSVGRSRGAKMPSIAMANPHLVAGHGLGRPLAVAVASRSQMLVHSSACSAASLWRRGLQATAFRPYLSLDQPLNCSYSSHSLS